MDIFLNQDTTVLIEDGEEDFLDLPSQYGEHIQNLTVPYKSVKDNIFIVITEVLLKELLSKYPEAPDWVFEHIRKYYQPEIMICK